MIYQIDPKLFDLYPYFCRGVIIAYDADNSKSQIPNLEKEFRDQINIVQNSEEISLEHQRIVEWAEIYKTFPIKGANRIRPSIASLVKRIRNGNTIPFISPLVCISNLISLKHLVPSGLIDVEKVRGNLTLGFAEGSEKFTPIGEDKTVNPIKGEIIYFDNGSNNVMCRAWNSRGGKATFISQLTNSAIIDVDGLTTVIPETEIEEAINTVATLVSKFCKAKVKSFLLNKQNSMVEF